MKTAKIRKASYRRKYRHVEHQNSGQMWIGEHHEATPQSIIGPSPNPSHTHTHTHTHTHAHTHHVPWRMSVVATVAAKLCGLVSLVTTVSQSVFVLSCRPDNRRFGVRFTVGARRFSLFRNIQTGSGSIRLLPDLFSYLIIGRRVFGKAVSIW
jgi:hypothetical protein